MRTCNKNHRYDDGFADLPRDQGDFGRHVCAGCAYERGYELGIKREKELDIEYEFEQLPDSQAGTVRHKSPYVAFATGYAQGFYDSY